VQEAVIVPAKRQLRDSRVNQVSIELHPVGLGFEQRPILGGHERKHRRAGAQAQHHDVAGQLALDPSFGIPGMAWFYRRTRSGRRWRRGCLRTAIPGMAWFYRRTRSGRRWRRGCLRTAIPGMAWFYRRTRSGRRWRRGSLRTDLAQPQAGLREAEQLGVDRLDLAGRDRLEITPRLERGGRAHVEQ